MNYVAIPIYSMLPKEFERRWNKWKNGWYEQSIEMGHSAESAEETVGIIMRGRYPENIWKYNQIVGFVEISMSTRDITFNVQKTLDTAFAKAFALIFEKGTGVIEKTYQRTKLEQDYQVRQYMADVKQDSKSLRAFSKKARDTGTKNLLLSGVSGIGMGVLGIGLPDIPVFTGMILKNIYETALQYGYSYESREEKYFILLLIRGAVSYGDTLCEIDGKVNEFIRNGILPEEYQDKEQIEQTAGALSKELLYMKFLQGIPVVGAVGGAYDAVYMKRITEYAELKYRHRYLAGRKKAENGQLCKRCKSYRDI